MAYLYMRQLGILRPDQLPTVTLIGTGGIGSALAMTLAKMGVPKFILYDPDQFQLHNISNQMVPREGSVDVAKVTVVADMIRKFSPSEDVKVITNEMYFEDHAKVEGVVISGLDSLDARKSVWNSLKNLQPDLYIDCRMGGQAGIVYSMNPKLGKDVRGYEKTLNQGLWLAPCTAQAIAYNIAGITMIVGSHLRKFVHGENIETRVMYDSRNLTIFKPPGWPK